MSRLLVQARPVVPTGQFFDRPGRDSAAPAITQDAEGTPKTSMGKAEATTNAEGSPQLQPGGRWGGNTWEGVVTTAQDGSRAIDIGGEVPQPERRSDNSDLFHYAGRQWLSKLDLLGNVFLLADREVMEDPTNFARSSVDVAGHWAGVYRLDQNSYAPITQQNSSYMALAFDCEITGDTSALGISTAETTDELATLAETRLQTILSSIPTANAEISGTENFPFISLRGHRIAVEYKSKFPGNVGMNTQIAAALGMLPEPFLALIDSIYFTAEEPDSPTANYPGGISTKPPVEPLYLKKYVDLSAVQSATPSAIARGLLFESARALLTYDIVLVAEAGDRWQIVPHKPLDDNGWQRPTDFVSGLDGAWILAHHADQRHPQRIMHRNKVLWPVADGVAQDLGMIIGDDGNVNSVWVAQNPHLALLYSGWLAKVNTDGLPTHKAVAGSLEHAVRHFIKQVHSRG